MSLYKLEENIHGGSTPESLQRWQQHNSQREDAICQNILRKVEFVLQQGADIKELASRIPGVAHPGAIQGTQNLVRALYHSKASLSDILVLRG